MRLIQVEAFSQGKRALLIGVAVAVACAACTRSAEPSNVTVQYYEEHEQEREEQLEKCMNDPGALRDTRACVNARHASAKLGMGGFRDLPPIGLAEKDDRLRQKPAPNEK